MNYRNMQISDYDSVIALWRDCDGVSLRNADSSAGIEKYLQRNPALSFVAQQNSAIVGTIMAGHDGKRGYIQHLAVVNEARGQGIAGWEGSLSSVSCGRCRVAAIFLLAMVAIPGAIEALRC